MLCEPPSALQQGMPHINATPARHCDSHLLCRLWLPLCCPAPSQTADLAALTAEQAQLQAAASQAVELRGQVATLRALAAELPELRAEKEALQAAETSSRQEVSALQSMVRGRRDWKMWGRVAAISGGAVVSRFNNACQQVQEVGGGTLTRTESSQYM
jgi:hypothetical protein